MFHCQYRMHQVEEAWTQPMLSDHCVPINEADDHIYLWMPFGRNRIFFYKLFLMFFSSFSPSFSRSFQFLCVYLSVLVSVLLLVVSSTNTVVYVPMPCHAAASKIKRLRDSEDTHRPTFSISSNRIGFEW
jgi:hypothetical protein